MSDEEIEKHNEGFMMIEGLHESVGNCESVFEREIWNKAIEAAIASIPEFKDDKMTDIKDNLRSLKK